MRTRHNLHYPDSPDMADFILVELRFLIPLGHDHQPVELVKFGIFLDERDDILIALPPFAGKGVLHPLRIAEIAF